MKLAKFFHIVRVSFARVFMLAVIVFLGSALLAIYSLIDFVNKIAEVFKSNPTFFTTLIIVTISIPLVSYALEKGLSLYYQEK